MTEQSTFTWIDSLLLFLSCRWQLGVIVIVTMFSQGCLSFSHTARRVLHPKRQQLPVWRGSSPRWSTSETATPDIEHPRSDLLNPLLKTLGIDADQLHQATVSSLIHPEQGYDGRFGKAAIRTYRSFLYPSTKEPERYASDSVQLAAAAHRCARHIDFLLKRHTAHQTAWIRHQDGSNTTTPRPRVFPFVFVLDHLRSAHNVGSLFRTADATGCAGVYTTGTTPHPYGNGAEKLHKTALGAEGIVPSRHFTTLHDAIAHVRQEHADYTIVGLETTDTSVVYTNYTFPTTGVALVVGNEVTGLDATHMAEHLDAVVEIPMFGHKNSLNVAACAPIVVYEMLRQWGV
jgi:23S rRNA (guanosine2251-2'-O)-methyltransferase